MFRSNSPGVNHSSRFCLAKSALAGLAALAALALPASGEVTTFSGKAEVRVTELVAGSTGQQGSQSLTHPSDPLPLQVVSLITSEDSEQFPSAAAAAAQFADPTELNSVNPEEFAINMTLNSVSPDITFRATALSQETRGVVFASGELGRRYTTGTVANLSGRLFLDGALTIIAADASRDLTGAFVTLRVTVDKISSTGEERVLDGSLELRGAAGGDSTVNVAGDFPTRGLLLTNLGILSSDFGSFRVLILPNIQVPYEYAATVGEPFELRATISVDAETIADNVGVAAVLGTPAATLSQVINLTNGSDAAAKFVDQISKERENPTGDPVFDEPAVGVCGLFGIEGLVGLAALAGMKRSRRRRCTPERPVEDRSPAN